MATKNCGSKVDGIQTHTSLSLSLSLPLDAHLPQSWLEFYLEPVDETHRLLRGCYSLFVTPFFILRLAVFLIFFDSGDKIGKEIGMQFRISWNLGNGSNLYNIDR
jgi:hypothetical protein